MDKNVLIRVRGLQVIDETQEEEPIELVVRGEYYFRNGSHYLRYEEHVEDFPESTVNYVKVSPKGVEVRKKGLMNVHMVFEKGKKNFTSYSTPLGNLEMAVAATRIQVKEEEQHLGIQADYMLEMNGEYAADCYLTIDVQGGLREGEAAQIF